MQILSINFSNNKQINKKSQKQVNFKKADYLFELKTIPNITCSCCGRKIINPEEMSNVWNRISKPLSTVIDKDIFQYWKKFFPNIYLKLVELSKKYPNKTLNSIFIEPNEYTEMKQSLVEVARNSETSGDGDKDLVNKSAKQLMETLLKTSYGYLKRSEDVLDVLKEYESYLQEDQLEAFELLKKYSQSHPDYRFRHIIRQCSVFYYHQKRNQEFEKEVYKKAGDCISTITRIIQDADTTGKIDIVKQNKKAHKIYCAERDPIIRGPKVKAFYSNLLTSNNMEYLIPDVVEQLDQLPIKYKNADTFFVRAYLQNYTDGAITGSIFEPYIARNINIETSEYPKGHSIFNRIITCTSCAQRKGSARSYAEYAKYHNEIHENTQKTFRTISDYVSKQPDAPDIIKSYPKQANAIIEENTNIYKLQNCKEFPNYLNGNRS